MRAPILLLLISSAATPVLAQTPAKPAAPAPAPAAKKPPSKLHQIVKKLADTAATAAAGVVVDTLLGQKGRAVANAMTGTGPGATACPPGYAAMAVPGVTGLKPSAGAALVNLTKSTVKKVKDTSAAAQAAAAQLANAQAAAAVTCQPVAAPGGVSGTAAMLSGVVPGAAAMQPGAATGAPNPMGVLAMATPVGLAAAAAPGAVKGIKGLFGAKPMDKIAILRELGKGQLVLKGVKFIEGTAEMEPGYEPTFAALGEALPLAEGTYLVHVAAEIPDKASQPDTALARKRLEKVWAALLVNGVSDQKIIAAVTLPPALAEGRKPAKHGDARVEVIRMP
jgi:hypothetical protein